MRRVAGSAGNESLGERIAAARAGLRRAGGVAVGLAVLLVALGAAALGMLIAAIATGDGPTAWPLLVDLLALAGVAAIAWWLGARWVRSLDENALAGSAERDRALADGSIKGPLELARSRDGGYSPGLVARAESEARAALGAGPVSPTLERAYRERLKRLGASAAVLAGALLVAGFAAPDLARDGISPLLRPVHHLKGPTLPRVTLSVASRTAARGSMVDVRVLAPMRQRARIEWRSGAAPVTGSEFALRDGAARTRVGPLDAALRVWAVTPDGAMSDTIVVLPEEPLLLTALEIEARYPDYLGREAERFLQPLPALVVPEGTELRIRGRATAPLRAARLVGGVAPDSMRRVQLTVEDDGFSARWTPTRSGTWSWQLEDAAGRPLAGATAPLDLLVVADSAPRVRISYPGTDTVMPADLRLPVIADADDDHGLRTAELVSWRVAAGGVAMDTTVERLPVPAGADRALLRTIMDLTPRRLLPGDTLKYFVRASDGAPRRNVGASPVYAVVFPSMAALREEVGERTRELVDRAERMASDAESIAREARDAEREMRRQDSSGRAGSPEQQRSSMEFGQADQLERMMEQDEQLMREAERMREEIDALQRAMETAGLQDPALQRQLDELRSLYERALSEELRQEMEQLNRALEDLDPEQVRAALERLAERQEEMREQLERSLELFRRAAAEQEMTALAQDSRELAGRQEAVAEALSDSSSAEAALDEQRALEQEAAALEARLDSLAQRLDEMGEQTGADAAQQAGQRMESAQQSMSAAQQQAQAGQMPQAGQQAQQAAGQMQQAAQQLDQSRQQMAQGWRQEAQQAVQQATQDVLQLAQEQEQLRQSMDESSRSGTGSSGSQREGMRGDQASLQQGLEAMGRNLSEAGQRSAMVSPEVGAALGRAMLRMDETEQALSEQGTPLPTEQAGEAVEALNRLAMELVANADRIGQSESGTGLEQALEQLAQMAREQGAINSQSGALMPLALSQQGLANQLQQLGQRQQGVAQGLEQIRDQVGERGDVLGQLEALAQEAEELAQQMQQGRMPPEARARQERLFHRLLDAGRTLERDEREDERRAERPSEADVSRAEAIDPSLLRGPRYRPPDEEQLRRLSPAYRRLILEYFDRLNRTGTDAPGGQGEATP